MNDRTHSFRFREHRALWISSALVLLVALAISLLPLLMQYAIPRAMVDAGVDEASVGNVDFNPFTGRFRLQDLDARFDGEPVLRLSEIEIDIAWLPLFQRQILIESVVLDSSGLLIEQQQGGRVRAAGFLTGGAAQEEQQKEAGESWSFGTGGGRFQNIDIRYRLADLTLELRIEEMTLGSLYSWRSDESGTLMLRGKLNGTPLQLDLKAWPFDRPARYEAEYGLQGLALETWKGLLGDAVEEFKGRLFSDARLTLTLESEDAWEMVHEGDLKVEQVGFASGEVTLQQERLTWSGTTRSRQQSAEEPNVQLDGTLEGEGLTFPLVAQDLRLLLADWQWQGEARMQPEQDGYSPKVQGRVQLSDFALERLQTPAVRARLAGLITEGLTVEGLEQVSVDTVAMQDLAVRNGVTGDPPVTLSALELNRIRWQTGTGLTLDALVMDGLQALLVRGPQGEWPLLTAWEGVGGVGEPDAQPAADAPDSGQAVPIEIGEIRVTGDSRISFRDETVDPVFDTTLTLEQARLGPLASARPDQPAQLELQARIGKYSNLDFQGEVRPFREQPAVDLEGRLQSVDLHTLTAYTRTTLGYEVSTGSLDANIDLEVSSGTIDAMNRLTLRNLQIKTAGGKEAEELQSKLNMPLGTALDMLRDGDDHIRLELPVTGNLSDPQFDLGDVIQTALAKATQKAAISYLKFALQPYGTILTVAQMAGKAAGAVRLEPVRFVAGAETPVPESLGYLDKLRELMQQRPQLNVRLCGMAVATDRTVLAARTPASPEKGAADSKPAPSAAAPAEVSDEAMRELARARADSLKDRLVTDYGVAPERLFICNPEIDPETGADPRVELMI